MVDDQNVIIQGHLNLGFLDETVENVCVAEFVCLDALVAVLSVLSLLQVSLCTVTWSVSTEATLKTVSSLIWAVSGASPSATKVAGSACSIAQITMGITACPVLMESRTFAKRRFAFHLAL